MVNPEDQVNKKIPLVEMFGPTIQGEGSVIGQQTYFLRFGLCDYKCKMCDSMHAVLPSEVKRNATWLTQQEIYNNFLEFHVPGSTNWVTFSGGNPAVHELGHLLGLLRLQGFKVNVETQGTLWKGWLGNVDSLTISPKGPGMGEKHDQSAFERFCDALYASMRNGLRHTPDLCVKIVVFDQRDLDFAAEIFSYLKKHPLLAWQDPSRFFYLSLGNPIPPPADGSQAFDPETREPLTGWKHHQILLQRYRTLYEDIQKHPILSQTRFLPQWHVFVWGNDQGH